MVGFRTREWQVIISGRDFSPVVFAWASFLPSALS